MDGVCPPESTQPFKQLGAVFFVKIIDTAILQLVDIIHLYNFNFRGIFQLFFQLQQFPLIVLIQKFIRISAVDVVPCRFAEGKVPGIGKAACPLEIKDSVRIGGGNLFRAVCGAGVHDVDFIHGGFQTVQTF